jgi:hypothetical protein
LNARTYRIGPLALELSLPDGPLADELDQAWGPFRGVPPGQTVKVAVSLREGAPAPWPRPVPRPVALPDGASLLAGDGWQARISADGLAVEVEQRAERLPLEMTVKILLARALSQNGGMLLHGAAVAHGGGAAAFIAPSGGGKSTLAKMAALGGVSVLADELVAVFPISGEWWAYGTPWHVGAAWGAPLKALGLLAWDSAPRVDALAPTALLKVLAENALLPDDEPATRKALFAAAEQALGKVRAVKLTFAPDARVAHELATLCAAGASTAGK